MQSVDSNIVGDHVTNVNVISLTGTAEINSQIRVYDGSTLLGSAVANAQGVWGFVPNLSDDQAAAQTSSATITHVLNNARGLAKVEGTAAANSTVSILDANTHAVLGHATADANGKWTYTQTKATGINFAVESDTTNSTLTTGAATTTNTTQAYSFTTPPLSDGVHNLTVTSTDAAGNVSSASTVFSVTVDTVAPTAPTITAFSPDSGTVGDGITSANVVTVTGAAEAGSTVKVYDGTTLLGSTTASSTGAWSFTTAALANGTHALTATAMDLAGNVSGASSALNVTVDTVAPNTPTIASFSPDFCDCRGWHHKREPSHSCRCCGSKQHGQGLRRHHAAGHGDGQWYRGLELHHRPAGQRHAQPDDDRHRCGWQRQRHLERAERHGRYCCADRPDHHGVLAG